MQVEIWSDVVCPWCYIGKRRFETALEGFPHPVELTWRSFQLDPTATSSPAGGHVTHLAEKYGRTVDEAKGMVDSVTATAAAEGLDYRLDLARSGNTFDAHRLLQFAKEHGVQDALKERLDKAYFTEGEAIADHDTLLRLAIDVGLPSDEVSQVLATDRFAADVQHDIAEARELGINGVPFFVIDRRYAVSGAQPAELLRSALEQAQAS
jgi:predicted DsbA family dithiol-disulfide isomerase